MKAESYSQDVLCDMCVRFEGEWAGRRVSARNLLTWAYGKTALNQSHSNGMLQSILVAISSKLSVLFDLLWMFSLKNSKNIIR